MDTPALQSDYPVLKGLSWSNSRAKSEHVHTLTMHVTSVVTIRDSVEAGFQPLEI